MANSNDEVTHCHHDMHGNITGPFPGSFDDCLLREIEITSRVKLVRLQKTIRDFCQDLRSMGFETWAEKLERKVFEELS